MKLFEAVKLLFFINMINIAIAVIPIYFLWNWIIPDLFSLPKIGLLQTLGLIIFIQLLSKPRFFEINKS